MGKLTALSIKAATKPKRYPDGQGLYLVVEESGSKNWQLRIQKNGHRRDIGLGSLSKVTLKMARERAAAVRAQIEAGIDPTAERRKAKGIPTFREAALIVHAERMKGWRNGKHNKQWISSLEAYAFPSFGAYSVALVDARAVRDVLADIWLTKPETARRVRQRIVTVIDWAVAKGYRETSLAMPVIDKGLPPQRRKVEHHPSLPYKQAAEFLSELRKRETIGRLALEAVMLTAGRSGEIFAKYPTDEANGMLVALHGSAAHSEPLHVIIRQFNCPSGQLFDLPLLSGPLFILGMVTKNDSGERQTHRPNFGWDSEIIGCRSQ